jgi:diguanylate cyclase
MRPIACSPSARISAWNKESQRAALLEWSQGILFSICGAERDVHLSPISTSDFGLWLHHRAGVMFQGSASLAHLEDAIRLVDSDLLPRIREARASDPARLTALLDQFQAVISEMKFLLNDMFQGVAAIENGRDPLTKALNRRFLPSILSREITMAATSGKPFSILMIDVDHFKQVNDRWGHPAGDAVLSQVADVILDTCRLSDFVFRYGGEEFLVALVETDTDAAYQAAERIRTRIELRDFAAPDKSALPVTASIGIATYDGHPDFGHLIQSADQALYRAKRDGRNCSMVAERILLDRAG